MRSRTKLSEYMTMEQGRHQPSQAGQLKGTGPQMRTLVRRIKKLAPSPLSILIQGETEAVKSCVRERFISFLLVRILLWCQSTVRRFHKRY